MNFGKLLLCCPIIFCLSTVKCQTESIRNDGECPFLEAQNSLLSVLQGDYEPSEQPAAPVVVNVTFLVRDVSDIDEMKRNTAFLMTMRQTWIDPRLRLNLPPSCKPNLRIPLNSDIQSAIWVPPTRLLNAIRVTTVTAPKLMQSISVTPNGRILFSRNFEASFPCVTSYRKFPFDSLQCDIAINTWASEHYIKLGFTGGKALGVRDGQLRMATHSFSGVKTGRLPNGMLIVSVALKRLTTYYILQIFVPNVMIVLVAWFSFLFPIDNVRISLLLSTLITSSIQYGTVANSLPRVGYLKGIDLWMLGCLSLIFFAMLEYSVLAYIMWSSDNGKTTVRFCGNWRDPNRIMSVIDKFSKVFYLLAFATFLVCYFVFFVAAGDEAKSMAENIEQNGGTSSNL